MEIWKTIKGCSYYQISNFGNIRSMSRNVNTGYGQRIVKERLLKKSSDKDGYEIICIRPDATSVKKTYKIHRLVAEYFLTNYNDYNCVNHKDLNKKNNHVSNLEYVNDMMNARHYHKINKSKKCVGVSYDNQKKKYKCRISVGGKRIYLGMYEKEEDAIKVYYDYVLDNKLNIITYL